MRAHECDALIKSPTIRLTAFNLKRFLKALTSTNENELEGLSLFLMKTKKSLVFLHLAKKKHKNHSGYIKRYLNRDGWCGGW